MMTIAGLLNEQALDAACTAGLQAALRTSGIYRSEIEAAILAYLTAVHPKPDAPSATTLCEDCPRYGHSTDDTRCTPCPRRHQWRVREFSAVTLECCDVCGMVKNIDQPNKPCRGPATVGPKSAATLKALDG